MPIPVYNKGNIEGLQTKNSLLASTSDQSYKVDLHWTLEPRSIETRSDRTARIISFHPGVTGWESYDIVTFMTSDFWQNNQPYWCLCAGTINRWDELKVPRKEMLKIFAVLHREGY